MDMSAGDIEKCERSRERLDLIILAELQRQKYPSAVMNCPIETIPYNLFLCKMGKDYYI